jgi:hypothetical protein
MGKPDEPALSTKSYIQDLAKKHGVSYVETANDRMANIFTALSGDEVTLDETELLIIALSRANVITKKEVMTLMHKYLIEERKIDQPAQN